jgi:hypothetical protein
VLNGGKAMVFGLAEPPERGEIARISAESAQFGDRFAGDCLPPL